MVWYNGMNIKKNNLNDKSMRYISIDEIKL